MGYGSIVYQLNPGGGFFSTFFFLCKAYLTAKSLRIPFYVEDRGWPYTHTRGWRDYFRSLEPPPAIMLNPRRVTHITQGSEPHFQLREYVDACRDIFKLQPHLTERIKNIISRMNGNYIAVFVRRGDKLIEESKFIPVADILAKIPHTPDTVFFVQSDDYTVVEEFQALHPPDKIVSTVPPTKRGSYHARRFIDSETKNPYKQSIVPLLEQSKQQIQVETEEMLVGIGVCLMAPDCWTDFTSNVGRFIKLAGRNVHFYPHELPITMDMHLCPSNEFPGTYDSPTTT